MSGRLLNGRYRLDTLIGRGGMAEVWRGEDQRLQRKVAVKLLDRAGTVDPVMLARFRQEARTVSRLSHPNIVTGYDLGTDDGLPYLVMELIEGESLAVRLSGGPLTVGDAVAIAGQVCDALAAAHAAGVVHRDIKPGNILLTPAGTVKVCDFGIARLQHGGPEGLTRTGTVIGTSDYMAPEQAAGDPVDARTDLYALGCVLYAMLTGAPPFTGDSPLSVLSQHLHREPAPVASHRPGVPAALAALVAELLAKRPADRPESATAVRARLAAVTASSSTLDATVAVATGATAPPPAGAAASAGPAARSGAGEATVAGPGSGRPPTRALPTESLGLRPEGRPPRWRQALAAAFAVVAVGVAAVAVAKLLNSPSSEPAAPITAPTIIAPSASSVATAPETQARVLLAVIDDQAEADQLEPEAAEDLREIVDKFVRELAEEDPRDAAREAEDLQEELDELREDGRISESAYASVASEIEALLASLPVATN